MFMVHCQLEPSQDFWLKRGELPAGGSSTVVAVIHRYGNSTEHLDVGGKVSQIGCWT